MASPKKNRKPSFFWQGMLILCPVVIMAVLAAGGILGDVQAIDRQMRRDAGKLLAELSARDFSAKFDHHRLCYEVAATDTIAEEGKLFPPGDPHNSMSVTTSLAEQSKAEVPTNLKAEPGFRYWPAFNADGTLRPIWTGPRSKTELPADEPPKPARWRLELTPEQETAWESLCREASTPSNLAAVRTAAERFKATSPGDDAMQNAWFIGQRAVIEANPTPAAVQGMLNTRYVVSETGIPLGTLGLIEALKRADKFENVRGLWDSLVMDAREEPNLLTPALIKLAEPLTQRDPALMECLAALKSRWSALEDRWGMAEAIQRSGRLHGVSTTNFWLEFRGQPWFCVLQPETNSWEDGPGNIVTNVYTKSRLFSLAAVEWAFRRPFFDELRVSIPSYFRVTAELAGANSVTVSGSFDDQPRKPETPVASISGRFPTLLNAEYVLAVYFIDDGTLLKAHKTAAVMAFGWLAAAVVASLVGFFAARRAFYRQLRLNEMKSNFVSSVSHELRAPIASVRLMAEGLERGKILGVEKQHEYFRFIVQECRRLSSLIENVLDFSRIEQGRKQYEFEATDLAALTGETVKLMQTYAAEQDIRISIVAKGEPAPVEIDGKAMQQALINLIDNAIKHSPKGSEIMVGLDCKPGCVELWVEDKGEGIPAAEREKIFERFYRIGSEMRRQTQGVGIGLSIVKHIVEAHGGTIVVRSAIGEGSRFTIALPATNGVRPK